MPSATISRSIPLIVCVLGCSTSTIPSDGGPDLGADGALRDGALGACMPAQAPPNVEPEVLVIERENETSVVSAVGLDGSARELFRERTEGNAFLRVTGHDRRNRVIVRVIDPSAGTFEAVYALDLDTNGRFDVLAPAEAAARGRCEPLSSRFFWSRSGDEVLVHCRGASLFDAVLVDDEGGVSLAGERVVEPVPGVYYVLRGGFWAAVGRGGVSLGPVIDRAVLSGAVTDRCEVPCGSLSEANGLFQVESAGLCSFDGGFVSRAENLDANSIIVGLPSTGNPWIARTSDPADANAGWTLERYDPAGATVVADNCRGLMTSGMAVSERGSVVFACFTGATTYVSPTGETKTLFLEPGSRIGVGMSVFDSSETYILLDDGVYDVRREERIEWRSLWPGAAPPTSWLRPARRASTAPGD